MRIVVALGGNALLPPDSDASATASGVAQASLAAAVAAVAAIAREHDVIVTHGNGPQVGNLMRQTELTREQVPPMPLDVTAVDRVYLNFREPNEMALGAVTLAECQRFIEEGHFPTGSMGPKVHAIHGFLVRGGRRGLITSPQKLPEALEGAAGTHFVGRI